MMMTMMIQIKKNLIYFIFNIFILINKNLALYIIFIFEKIFFFKKIKNNI